MAALRIDPNLLRATESLKAIRNLLGSSSVAATDHLERLTEMSRTSEAFTDSLVERMNEAADQPRAAFESMLERQHLIAQSLALTHHAASTLASLDYTSLGAAVRIHERHEESIASALLRLTRSFEGLYSDVRSASALLELPRFVIERPPQELYIHTGLLESITTPPHSPTTRADGREKYEDLAEETESALEEQLEAFSSPLVVMWKGALEALASRNPDRVRHACSSLRELLTHVLHGLSPDEEVKSWSTSDKDFDKGRPTRMARLRYIVRHVDHARFGRFLRLDVASAVDLFDALHQGVHEPNADFTEEQVRLLALRAGQVLSFLFEVAKYWRN